MASSSRAQRTSSPPLDGISALLEQISGFRTLEIEQLETKRRAQRSQTAYKEPLSDQELALALFAEEAESLLSVSKDRSRDGWDNEDRLDELLEMEDMARYDRAMALALAEGRDPPPRPARLRRRDRASMHGGQGGRAPVLARSAQHETEQEQPIPRNGKGKAREEHSEEPMAPHKTTDCAPWSSLDDSLSPSPSSSPVRRLSAWASTQPSHGGFKSAYSVSRHTPPHNASAQPDDVGVDNTRAVSDPRRYFEQAESPSPRLPSQGTASPSRSVASSNGMGGSSFVLRDASTIAVTYGVGPMPASCDVPISLTIEQCIPGRAVSEGLFSPESQAMAKPTFKSRVGRLLSSRQWDVPASEARDWLGSTEKTVPTPSAQRPSTTRSVAGSLAATSKAHARAQAALCDTRPTIAPSRSGDFILFKAHDPAKQVDHAEGPKPMVLCETAQRVVDSGVSSFMERDTPRPSRLELDPPVTRSSTSFLVAPVAFHAVRSGMTTPSPYVEEHAEERVAIARVPVESPTPLAVAATYAGEHSVEGPSAYEARPTGNVEVPREAPQRGYFVPGGYDFEGVLREEAFPAETPEVRIRQNDHPEELTEVNAFEPMPSESPPSPDPEAVEAVPRLPVIEYSLPKAEFSRPATHPSVEDIISLDEAPREAAADYALGLASRAASPVFVEDTALLEVTPPEAAFVISDVSLPSSRAPSPFVSFLATPANPEPPRFYPTPARLSSPRIASRSHAESCLICGGTIDGTVIRVRCGHTFDVACLQEMFSKATIDESLFPPKCCQGPLELAEVERFLTSTLLERFRKKTLEFSTANRVYCYNRHCSAFLGAVTASAVILRCAECASTTCASCKRPAHRGSGCGAVDGDDAAVLKLGTAKGWRRCPSCQHLIERPDGCYHIQCRCGQAFCYLCGVPWDAKLKVCSGGCPLFDVPPEAEEELGAVGGARVAVVERRVPMVGQAPLRPAPRAPGVVPGGVLVYQVEGPVHAPTAAPAAPRIRGW